jgi:hypothetical protein
MVEMLLLVHKLQPAVTEEQAVELGITAEQELETLHLYHHHKELMVVDRVHTQAAMEAVAEAHQEELALEIHNTLLEAAEVELQTQLQDLQLHTLEVAEAVAELTQGMETAAAAEAAAGQEQIITAVMEQMVSEAAEAEQEGNLLVQA